MTSPLPQDDDDVPTSNDEYLWSGRGAADPLVASLERALAPLRTTPPAPPLPAARQGRLTTLLLPLAAATAAVALFVLVARPVDVSAALAVSGLPGVPTLAAGATLDTGPVADAVVDLGAHGQLRVGPRTRLRLDRSDADGQALFLERGTLSALVDAPPRFFQVGTPSVTAVDLGCAYDLTVDDDGTFIRVTLGAVSLEDPAPAHGPRALTIVPAGASARADRGARALPFATDTTADVRAAALALDVDAVLRGAGPRDAISVWHLVLWADRAERPARLARLVEIFPPPTGVDPRDPDVDALFRWREAIEEALRAR